MPASRSLIRVALDVNFPEPILTVLSDHIVDVDLVPLRAIDDRLTDLDDRTMLLALRQEGFEWLATANHKMLRNPSELAAMLKAKLKVFAIEGVGHDMLRATGALLLDLPGAIRRAVPDRAEVFWSRPRVPPARDPWDLIAKAAANRHTTASELYKQVRVGAAEAELPWRDRPA